jgi:2-keto-4-pentenoate hydratase
MDEDAIARAAGYLAEAFETGNPLAPLPGGLCPASLEDGEAIAAELLDRLGFAPFGLRLAPGPSGAMLAGPMLGTRILAADATVAITALRHPRVSAAAIGVLGEALDPSAAGAPVFAALHPAIDVAASRLRDGPGSDPVCAADLAGLGYVVAGRRRAMAPASLAVACAALPRRPRGQAVDLAAQFDAAAAAARRLGGLPAGAVLVVAGLTSAAAPAEGETWAARLGALGSARATFAAGTGLG